MPMAGPRAGTGDTLSAREEPLVPLTRYARIEESPYLQRALRHADPELAALVADNRMYHLLHYGDPVAAAHWLQDVFGFFPASHIPDEFTDHTWIEFHIGNASLILFARPGEAEGVTHIPWVFVDDLDAQYRQLKQRGAEIVEEPIHHGARWFTAKDLAGHQWTFAQASPRMYSR